MLQHEAHVNTFDKINGSSPLHDACFSGSLKSLVCLPPPLASALLSLEAEAVSCLWVCCRCVKALVEAGANVNMHTKSTKDKNKGAVALHYAAQENRHDIVEYLIRKSAGVNIQDARGCTPLHYAAYKGPSSTAIQRAFARACTRLHALALCELSSPPVWRVQSSCWLPLAVWGSRVRRRGASSAPEQSRQG